MAYLTTKSFSLYVQNQPQKSIFSRISTVDSSSNGIGWLFYNSISKLWDCKKIHNWLWSANIHLHDPSWAFLVHFWPLECSAKRVVPLWQIAIKMKVVANMDSTNISRASKLVQITFCLTWIRLPNILYRH